MTTLNPSIFGFSETNLDWTKFDSATKPFLRRMTAHWRHHNTITASSTETYPTLHKPGGVVQAVLGPTKSRIRSQSRDPTGMGRWVEHVLTGNNGTKVSVFTCYRVQQANALRAGVLTAAQQQWRAMTSANLHNANPKSQFILDLTKEIGARQHDQHEIIVMLDANDKLSNPTMEHFLHECHLEDLLYAPERSPQPATFIEGQHPIDFILGTPNILRAVIKSGLIAPLHAPVSDHRCLYVDIDENILFGAKVADLADLPSRILNSGSPLKVEAYTKVLLQLLDSHAMTARLDALIERCITTRQCSQQDRKVYNTLDAEMTQYMLVAERKCGKPPRKFHYSPALSAAGHKLRKLKIQRRQLYAHFHSTNQHVTPTQEATLRTSEEDIRVAYALLKQIQQEDTTHRNAHLEALIAKATAAGHNTQATQLTQQHQAEFRRKVYGKIRHALDPTSEYGQLDRVLVPDETTPDAWREITESDALFDTLLSRGQKDFARSEGTPLTRHPIAASLPPWHLNANAELLLQGSFFPPQDVTPEVKAALDALKFPDTQPPEQISISISDQDFRSGFARCGERTASSPSGRHLGHYKAALYNEHISSFHSKMMTFAIANDSPPDRWCLALQIWLEKDRGSPKISRLRIIQLLEADMNMIFKIVWGRRLVWHAEDNGHFSNTSQYGSRPGKTAISAVLLKRLTYDIIRQTATESAMLMNDAAGCYDSIIPSFGAISCMRLGLPRVAAECLLRILRQMRYRTRTAYGVSPSYFGNIDSDKIPAPYSPEVNAATFLLVVVARLFGIMQGSGNGPCIWLAIHLVLFTALDQSTEIGLQFVSTTRLLSTARKGEAFVDDTDLWVTASTLSPDQPVVFAIQILVRMWHRLLQASGGDLAFHKCFWYHINFDWHNGIPTYKAMEITETVSLPTGNIASPFKALHQVPTNKGLRVLGVRLAPDGSQTDEFKFRLAKATQIKKLLWASHLNPQETETALDRFWWPSVSYPLGVTTFSKQQCDKLQATFQHQLMAKLGYNRSMPASIRYGPSLLGGLSRPHVHTEQALSRIKLLLHHLRSNDEVGTNLRISLSYLQQDLGLQLQAMTTEAFPYAKQSLINSANTWLFHTWSDMTSLNLSLELPRVEITELQRDNDAMLMDLFHRLSPPAAKLRHAQRCRIFLRAQTLSDITDGAGTHLHSMASIGQPMMDRLPLQEFPTQARPSATSWRVFRELLQHYLRDNNRLRQPLGNWRHAQRTQQWQFSFSPSEQALYEIHPWPIACQQQPFTFRKHAASRSPTRQLCFAFSQNTVSLPADSVPVSFASRNLRLTGFKPLNQHPPPIDNPSPLLSETFHTTSSHSTATIDRALDQGTLNIFTSGSLARYKGGYAWSIADGSDEILSGGGSVSAHPSMTTTHRMHLCACITAIQYLIQHSTKILSRQGQAKLHLGITSSDSYLVKRLQRLPQHIHPLAHDYDLVQAIIDSHILDHVQLSPRFCSNKEDNNATERTVLLSLKSSAAEFRELNTDRILPAYRSTVNLLHRQDPITWDIASFIRQIGHQAPLTKYLKFKNPTWTDDTFSSIAWEEHGHSLRALSTTYKRRIIKFIHEWTPTMAQQHRFDEDIAPTCPCCNDQEESLDHMLKCPDERMETARNMAIATWSSKLIESSQLKTPEPITAALRLGLQQWFSDTPHTPPGAPPHVQTAFRSQTEIGWKNLLKGRVSDSWASARTALWPPGTTGFGTNERWLRLLVKTTWEIFSTIWITRNGILYGATQEEQEEMQRQTLMQRIELIFSTERFHLHPRYFLLLDSSSPAQLANTSLAYQDKWIATIDCALQASARSSRHFVDSPPRTVTQPRSTNRPRQSTLYLYYHNTNDDWADPAAR